MWTVLTYKKEKHGFSTNTQWV